MTTGEVMAGQDSNSECPASHDENEQNNMWRIPGANVRNFAFDSKRAMADNEPLPTDLHQGTFVDLAQKWLQESRGRCAGWNRTITYVSTNGRPHIIWKNPVFEGRTEMIPSAQLDR
jgi:hypothetical protein